MYTSNPGQDSTHEKIRSSAVLGSFPHPPEPKQLLFASRRVRNNLGYLDILVELMEATTTYHISTTNSAQYALDTVRDKGVDVLLLDLFVEVPEEPYHLGPFMEFPAYLREGLWALDQIKEHRPSQRVIALIDNIPELEGFCLLQGAEKVFTLPYCTSQLTDYLRKKDPFIVKEDKVINE